MIRRFLNNVCLRCRLARKRRSARALARWRRCNAALYRRACAVGLHDLQAIARLEDAYHRLTRPELYGVRGTIRRALRAVRHFLRRFIRR